MTAPPDTEPAYDPGVPNADEWITRNEAAEFLGVRPQTVDYYAVTGRVRKWKNPTTGAVWFHSADLRAVKRQREATPNKTREDDDQ